MHLLKVTKLEQDLANSQAQVVELSMELAKASKRDRSVWASLLEWKQHPKWGRKPEFGCLLPGNVLEESARMSTKSLYMREALGIIGFQGLKASRTGWGATQYGSKSRTIWIYSDATGANKSPLAITPGNGGAHRSKTAWVKAGPTRSCTRGLCYDQGPGLQPWTLGKDVLTRLPTQMVIEIGIALIKWA